MNFGDVNPPFHAGRPAVYKLEKKRTGAGDLPLPRPFFQQTPLNFTWWVNRKDAGEKHFQGGFSRLDTRSLIEARRFRPRP